MHLHLNSLLAAQADLGPDLINKLGGKYFLKLAIDLAATAVLLYGIYLPNNNRNREYIFTFFMLNVVIFHVAFLLNGVTNSE